MPRYFAFLRAINVGGHVVRMETLRGHFAELGFSAIETFINSGNVIFQDRSSKAATLESRIAAHLEARLGYPVPTFLRNDLELAAIHAFRPFESSEVAAALTLCIGFLARPLDAAQSATLSGLETADDRFRLNGKELYWLSRNRQSESKISNAVLERKLKTSLTFRNVSSVGKLATKYLAAG